MTIRSVHSAPAFVAVSALLFFALACAIPPRPASDAPPAVAIKFDPSQRFQRITGWGGEIPDFHWSGGDEPLYAGPTSRVPENLRRQLVDELVDDLGCNRYSQILFAIYIEPQNDNSDPHSIDPAGFDFSAVDPYIREFVVPLRDRVRARGKDFIFSIKVMTIEPPGKPQRSFIAFDAEEYAEFAIAVLRHYREFGVDVRYWMIENEPDISSPAVWTPAKLARFAAVLGARLQAEGFSGTRIAAPEASRPGNVAQWLGALAGTPGVAEHLGQITFHCYDYDATAGEYPPQGSRIAVANWARQLHLDVAQTEISSWGAKFRDRWSRHRYDMGLDLAEDLIADLIYAQVNEWRFYLVFGKDYSDAGGINASFLLMDREMTRIDKPASTWVLRQFTRYVRPGSVRVAANVWPDDGPVRAVGFLSPQGKPVLVAFNRGARPSELRISQLPAGDYRITMTTPEKFGAELPSQSLAAGQPLIFSLPAKAVVTFWQP